MIFLDFKDILPSPKEKKNHRNSSSLSETISYFLNPDLLFYTFSHEFVVQKTFYTAYGMFIPETADNNVTSKVVVFCETVRMGDFTKVRKHLIILRFL